jgi:hypothetical protein
MGLDRKEEEEKMKQKDREEEMKDKKNKEEEKIHCWKIPLLGKSHRIRGTFLRRNLQQGRIHVLISPS